METAKELRERMKSIQDTQKITNAMYLISSNRLQKARRELAETESYFYGLQAMIARILRHIPELENRYLAPQSGGENADSCGYLVVTADKGLAGAYNHNILKLAGEAFGRGEKAVVLAVGQAGRQYFLQNGIPVEEQFLYTAQNPTLDRARVIAARILALYGEGRIGRMELLYTQVEGAGTLNAKRVRLLPLERSVFGSRMDLPGAYQEEFTFYPSAGAVLDHVIPDYLAGYVYGALMEACCAEHQARMDAMGAATDNAGEMLRELSVAYNRVRQAAITREITEVAAGARAQKGNRL